MVDRGHDDADVDRCLILPCTSSFEGAARSLLDWAVMHGQNLIG